MALEARTEWQRSKDEKWICQANRLLGLVALHNGDLDEATALLTGAIEECKRLRQQDGLPHFMGSLGELAEEQGNLSIAASWYQQAIDIFREKNNPLYLASDLLNLGRVMLGIGDIVGAGARYEESLKFARECGRTDIIAKAMYTIASLESTQNQRQSAESNARQALDLFRRLGMKREQIETEALLERLGAGS